MSQDYLDKLIEKDKAGTQIQSIPLHDTELREITIDDPITVEGNPINFSTKNEQNAIQTVVDLEPIQDLHGYSKPWVGGAGKNLFTPITSDSYKYSHWTLSDETLFGQPVYTSQIAWNGLSSWTFFEVGTYVFSVYAKATANETATIYCKTTEAGGRTIAELTPLIKSCNVTTSWQRFDMQLTVTSAGYLVPRLESSNATSTLYVSCWQIEKSQTVTPYEPYTNICPILPHEEIKIGGCGKNLYIGSPIFDDYTNIRNWTQDSSTHDGHKVYKRQYAWSGTFKYITLPIGTYIFSCYAKADDNNHACGIYILNENTTATITPPTYSEFVISNTWNRYSYTFNVISTGTVALRFESRTSNDSNYIYISEYQLEVGSTATSYEPYKQSNSLTLPLPEDVYGGTLNLETGELRVEKGICKVSDLTWSIQANSQYGKFKSSSLASKIYKTTTEAIAISEYYQSKSDQAVILYNDQIYTNGIGEVKIRDSRYIDDANATAWVAACGNCKIIYRLADSAKYTIHLTPSQLKLFKDVNNLNSSDYTTLTVTYHSNSIATLAPATDTTDGLLSAIDKRALDRTEEIIEGNPIAFETESAQVAKSTIVDLEPIQDLHGFTKPWVGGAGKNLLPMTVDWIKTNNTGGTWTSDLVYEYNGVIYTILTDSDNNVIGINANGTASTTSSFVLYYNQNGISELVGMKLNGSSSGSSSTYGLGFEAKGIRQETSDFTITSEYQNSKSIYIRILQGIQVTNVKFYPMVRLSTVTDATFEPYTNIASISGRSEVDILGCGKNLLYRPYYDSSTTRNNITFTVNNDGSILVDGTASADTTFKLNDTTTAKAVYKGLSGSQIIGSGCPTGGSSTTYYLNFQGFEVSGNGINDTGSGTRVINVSDISNFSIVQIYIVIRSGVKMDNLIFRPMIRSVSDTNTYEPYAKSNNLTISLGQTVYGGQLDVENGVLVVDMKYVTITSMTRSSATKYFANVSPVAVADDFVYIKSDKVETQDGSADNPGIFSNWLGAIRLNTPKEFDTASDMMAFYGNEINVCYKLETPTTISLTPEQVKLLQGINTITTNADNITLTYRNGSVATLNDLESLYAKLKAYIDSLHSS